MGACHIAEPRLKAVVGVKLTEAFVLNPAFTPEHFLDDRSQIVIDRRLENTPEECNGMRVGIKESLLFLAGQNRAKCLPEYLERIQKNFSLTCSPAITAGAPPESTSITWPPSEPAGSLATVYRNSASGRR